jgi:hypothetical protein
MLKEGGGASIYPAVEQAPEAEQALPQEEARAFSSALAWPAYSASLLHVATLLAGSSAYKPLAQWGRPL